MASLQSTGARVSIAAQAFVLAVAVLVPSAARAQAVKYKIDERSSLAWWQMSPHLGHLWATTCPGEPSWQPGEERSAGWVVDQSRAPKTGHAAVMDTIHVPLYPRPEASAVCSPAVRGEITVGNKSTWAGVKGLVAVRGEYLITGLDMRDNYARKAVLQTSAYPEVRFQIDSLTHQTMEADTLVADAVGVFELRGVRQPKVVRIRAWQEPLGLRVTGKFDFPSSDLVEKYKMSRLSLGLGVGTGLWKLVHLGIDAVMTPVP